MMFNYIPEGTATKPNFKGDVSTQTLRDRGIIEFKADFQEYTCFIYINQNSQAKAGWIL